MGEFGLTYEIGGFLFAIYFYPYVVMQFLGGFVGDRVGRKKVLLTSTIFWSLISLLTGFSKTFWEAFVYRLILGFGHGAYFANDRAIVSAYTPKEKGGVGQAVSLTGAGIGMALGMGLGGLLAQSYGWRLPFIVLSLPAFFGGFLIAKFIKEPPRLATFAQREGKNRIRYTVAVHSRDLLLLYVSNAMMMYAYWLLGAWFPVIMVEAGIKELGTASTYASLFGFSAVPGLLLFGTISDRMAKRGIGRRFLMSLTFVFVTLFTLLIAFAIGTYASTLIITVLVILEGFFIWGFFSVLHSLVADITPPVIHGTVFGLLNTIGFMSSIIAPWLTGMIRDVTGSFVLSLSITALPTALGCLVTLFISPPFRLKEKVRIVRRKEKGEAATRPA